MSAPFNFMVFLERKCGKQAACFVESVNAGEAAAARLPGFNMVNGILTPDATC
jgi:hypothetical protein